MGTEKIVRDYMIPLTEYPHIKATQTLHEAIASVLTRAAGREGTLDYGMLLVLDDRNQLLGSLRLGDILRGLGPGLLQEGMPQKFEGLKTDYRSLAVLWEDSFFKTCKEYGQRPVKDFLTPFDTFVKADDPILKALYIMLTTHITSIPAVEERKVVGVVRLKELFVATCEMCRL